jgi:hypothetical protein
MDAQIAQTPMPPGADNKFVLISCNDCLKRNVTPHHFVGNKCQQCGGYNTAVMMGPVADPNFLNVVLQAGANAGGLDRPHTI